MMLQKGMCGFFLSKYMVVWHNWLLRCGADDAGAFLIRFKP